MEIFYLADALNDMAWFRRYYSQVFPAGRDNAKNAFLNTERLLQENPKIGHPIEYVADMRECPIRRTPFSLLYRIKDNRLEILRVIDQRSAAIMPENN